MRLGLARHYSPDEKFEAAVERLHSQLIIDPAIDSQIIWIRYRSQDPVLASEVVNTVAREYQRQHLAINLKKAESSFYFEQIDQIQNDLKGLQEKLLKIKQDHGIVSYAEQSKALLKKLDTYDVGQTNVQKEIIRIRAKVEKIQDLRKARPELLIPLPELAQDPQLADLENKLVNLKFQIKTVLQRFTPESRQAQTVREQIGHLHNQIRDQVNTLLERELAKLREFQAEEQAIGQTMKGMTAELEVLPVVEMNLSNLKRDINTKESILSVLFKEVSGQPPGEKRRPAAGKRQDPEPGGGPLAAGVPQLPPEPGSGPPGFPGGQHQHRLFPGILGRFPENPGGRGALPRPLGICLHSGTLR